MSRLLEGKRGLRDALLGVLVLVLLAGAVLYQNRRFEDLGFRVFIYEQRINLPPSDVLRFATLGYDSVYANWLWLVSIQAFGSGWRTEDGTAGPIFNFFDTLTDVDPQFISAYRFGNLVVGDQRGDYELGRDLLRKGTLENVRNYDLPYLGIYNALWMANEEADARWFAIMLRRMEHAPNFMLRLEEFIERTAGRYEMAFEYNVRYWMDYHLAGNDVERDLIEGRIQVLLDQWYKQELTASAERYLEAHGEHPTEMEDLLTEEFMPAFEAPTFQSFRAAMDRRTQQFAGMPARREIPQEIVDEVIEDSTETIVGLPPCPWGTWYFIHEPTRIAYPERRDLFDDSKGFPYLTTAQGLMDIVNRHNMNAQEFILDFYREHERRPTQEEIAHLLTRDPVGGHYVYQREAEESPTFGVFYSTGQRRLADGADPRMGVRGPDPHRFLPDGLRLAPRLSDFPEEEQWGREHGYILDDGTELWEPGVTDPDLEMLLPPEDDEMPQEMPAPPPAP